ncbi:PilN domain-containing protein [Synechocystis sp. PCC 7509]|uniref:PilN domain-containing protein n=1 Tax=Synechocystis sp. PCC 7509 TaxID=927677 RepID=UPI0002AC2F0D|nr:pilus assembly protein PilN [Synechocystis sp. PCC 7509]
MYSLDVNFVKSRKPVKADTVVRSFNVPTLSGDMTPIYIGLGVGLASCALVGVGLLILSAQNSRIASEVVQLDQTLSTLGIQEQEIQRIKIDLEQIKGQNRALATVFNQIRPWSAILQDIRDRIPANAVQIQTIKQIALILTLKQSSFLQSAETKIITATLVENPVQSSAGRAKLPQVVNYTIQSTFSEAGATQLLRELERKGTLGLVTRIRTLQQRGLIQQ